jgi:hypothetical protein
MTTLLKTRNEKAMAPQPESLVNDALRTFTDAEFPVGSVVHQGDLILVRLDVLPASAKPRKNRQLAEGSTQGSRHVIKRGSAFDCEPTEVAKLIAAHCKGAVVDRSYVGPVFGTKAGVADLVHPEHGNHCYRGDMTIAVVYQRNLDAEEREARVQD